VTEVREVWTGVGQARVHVDEGGRPRVRVVLGHGAGGGVDAPDLAALAAHLPSVGVGVWRVEQPWRVAGRRVAPAPGTLDRAWLETLSGIPRERPFVVGGRSAGARVACRTASHVHADAVVALAFPLHPPGRPERSRADELDVDIPLLVVQGARDPFGRPEEFPPSPGRSVVPVPGDHTLARDLATVVSVVTAFVTALDSDGSNVRERD
jgi:predicted alpha/beta-hydrolase family hydrolase